MNVIIYCRVSSDEQKLGASLDVQEERLRKYCNQKGDTLVKYATAGLDPNIFVQKYMIELPTEEEIKKFISTANY